MRPLARLVSASVAALALVVVVSYWALPRRDASPQPLATRPSSLIREPGAVRQSTGVRVAKVEPGSSRPAGAEDRALEAALASPSDTVRDGTLATAIRRAGFVCSDVVGAMPFRTETPGWRVSCSGAFVYSVVSSPAGFVVEPIYQGPAPFGETPRPVPLEQCGAPVGPTQ